MCIIGFNVCSGPVVSKPLLGFGVSSGEFRDTVNLHTNIMEFRGFDSSIIFILRGGIPRPVGNLPESLSQAILVGIILVGRLGVEYQAAFRHM